MCLNLLFVAFLAVRAKKDVERVNSIDEYIQDYAADLDARTQKK